MRPLALFVSFAAVTALFLQPGSARADEGMWLYNHPPLKQLAEKYRFEPSAQWLEHLQKASVPFNSVERLSTMLFGDGYVRMLLVGSVPPRGPLGSLSLGGTTRRTTAIA